MKPPSPYQKDKDGNQKRKLQEQNRQAIKDKPRRWKHISVQ